ncbi:MAG: hypothetical protein NTU43_03235, partial [Bacteroidetes bacterium]|nr:hypothetical protein [Bacteroidota bacterium]
MKRKIFILIPLIIFAKQNFAQFANPYKINYNYYYTFDSTYDTFFGSTVHSIYPYTVVKSYTNINGDSVYEFSKTVTSDNSECMKIIKPSILGKTFTILDSGRFLITTFSNDTIYFRTTDTIGSTWNCYRNDTLNLIIDAKIEKRELQEVCGELDTVITFKFKVYDKNKKPIQSHFLNFCRVQLSYNHGFIETFSLRSFPNFESYYNSPSLHIFKLTGIANSNLSDNKGITSFYRHELYNYDVGDEIQEYHAFANRATSYSYGDSYHYYLIKKVIDKIIKNDTVKYKIEEHVWSHSSKISTEGLESQIVDTLTNAINTLLIRIDYNNIYTPSLLQEYSGAIEYFDDNKSYRYSDYSTLIKRNDTCYGTNDDPYSYNHQSFAYTGIGGYYYYSSYSGQFMQSKLLYVKKGNKILGTPYPFALGINDKAEESLIKVYPNPANN